MDLVLHGILLAAALVMVTIVGVLLLQKEGIRRYVGIISLVYVFCVLVLVGLALMGV